MKNKYIHCIDTLDNDFVQKKVKENSLKYLQDLHLYSASSFEVSSLISFTFYKNTGGPHLVRFRRVRISQLCGFGDFPSPPIVRENFTIVRFFQKDIGPKNRKKTYFSKSNILILKG